MVIFLKIFFKTILFFEIILFFKTEPALLFLISTGHVGIIIHIPVVAHAILDSLLVPFGLLFLVTVHFCCLPIKNDLENTKP